MFAVARNLLYETVRKNAKQVPLDPEATSFVDVSPTPISIVHHRREHRLMHEALRHIPVDAHSPSNSTTGRA